MTWTDAHMVFEEIVGLIFSGFFLAAGLAFLAGFFWKEIKREWKS